MSKKLKSKEIVEETINNRKVGRPKKKDGDKVIYQKIPIRYETYKKLKEVTNREKITFSDLVEDMLKNTYVI